MKRQTATVDCPKSMVGRVIGKNGETIKALQTYTGALIQIDQTVEPTKVTISGTPHSLSLAVSMVTDVVKGTFKGFALLRQIANPATARGAMPNMVQPRPVYAPGYGLIPPSQVCTHAAVGQITGLLCAGATGFERSSFQQHTDAAVLPDAGSLGLVLVWQCMGPAGLRALSGCHLVCTI
jgi:hypothetical protein